MQISYITLSAVDYFDIGQNITEISKTLEKSNCKWLVISFQVIGYPPFQSEEIVNALINLDKPVSYSCINSNAGHDAFLLEREIMENFLLFLRKYWNFFIKKIKKI